MYRASMKDPKQAMLEAIERDKATRGPTADFWLIEKRKFLEQITKQLNPVSGSDFVDLMNAWHDLYRSGIIGWGYMPDRTGDEDMVHLTRHGQNVLENVRRDPSNPNAYLAYLDSAVPPNTVARSYLEEALKTYGAGCDKATVVLAGCASEALILELRDAIGAKYDAAPATRPRSLQTTEWRVRTIIDGIHDVLTNARRQMDNDLWERFDYRWTAVIDIIRRARNEVGHPSAIAPVTRDDVHVLLLSFPEVAKLTRDLITWAASSFSP